MGSICRRSIQAGARPAATARWTDGPQDRPPTVRRSDSRRSGRRPTGRTPAEDRSASLPIRRTSRNARRPRRDRDRPRAPSAAASRAGAGRGAERGGPSGQRSSIYSTIAADSASAKSPSTRTGTWRRGLGAPNSGLFKSPAPTKGFCDDKEFPCTRAHARPARRRASPSRNRSGPPIGQTLTVEAW